MVRASSVLIKVLVGEDWVQLTIDCSVQPPFCDTSPLPGHPAGDCGIPREMASLFFASYALICRHLIGGLITGFFVSGITRIGVLRGGLGPYPASRVMLEPTIKRMALQFAKFDPSFSGKVGPKSLSRLLKQHTSHEISTSSTPSHLEPIASKIKYHDFMRPCSQDMNPQGVEFNISIFHTSAGALPQKSRMKASEI